MKRRFVVLALLSLMSLAIGAEPASKATPISTREVVLYSLEVALPRPEIDKKQAQSYAKELFTKLEKHFRKIEGVSPTYFELGPMHRSLTYHNIIIWVSVDKELRDDATVAKWRSYPFKTRVRLRKQRIITEVFEIATP